MQNHKAIKSIFQDAIEISPASKRASFVDFACRGDKRLKSSVFDLLEAYESAGSFLESPATFIVDKDGLQESISN